MAEMMIEIPDALANLPDQERSMLIRTGLYQATQGLIEQLEQERIAGKEHLQRFETKYGMPFTEFETKLLPTLTSLEAHEDYNDWFYWQMVVTEKEERLTQLKQVGGGNGC